MKSDNNLGFCLFFVRLGMLLNLFGQEKFIGFLKQELESFRIFDIVIIYQAFKYERNLHVQKDLEYFSTLSFCDNRNSNKICLEKAFKGLVYLCVKKDERG